MLHINRSWGHSLFIIPILLFQDGRSHVVSLNLIYLIFWEEENSIIDYRTSKPKLTNWQDGHRTVGRHWTLQWHTLSPSQNRSHLFFYSSPPNIGGDMIWIIVVQVPTIWGDLSWLNNNTLWSNPSQSRRVPSIWTYHSTRSDLRQFSEEKCSTCVFEVTSQLLSVPDWERPKLHFRSTG